MQSKQFPKSKFNFSIRSFVQLGLYNHSTVPLTKEEEELEMRMNGQL